MFLMNISRRQVRALFDQQLEGTTDNPRGIYQLIDKQLDRDVVKQKDSSVSIYELPYIEF